MEPFLDLRVGHYAGPGREEMLRQKREKLFRGHALERVLVEPPAQELIEGVAPEPRLEKRQEERAELVRHD
jgi:hypothetical protein